MASEISRDVNGVVSGTALYDSEQLYTLVNGVTGDVDGDVTLGEVPTLAALLELDEMSIDEFGEALLTGELVEVVVIRPEDELNSSSLLDEALLEDAKKALNARSGYEILKNPSDPFYPVIREYRDVVSKEPPSGLPPDRGVRHEIDLVPGTKYCVTRQWPLPRERCDVIDAFFRAKHEAGLVRESKSPHSTPTFCVRKTNGKWCIVHEFNKLNAATIPAQTSIPRKDVLQNNMVGCTLYSTLDLVDGLSNEPATFNRLVTQLFRPHRAYAQTYFDDIFVHIRAELGKTDVENHVEHLRTVIEYIRTNKLYGNIDKCIFGAEEIPFLECFVEKHGLRADPAKVKDIVEWPVLRSCVTTHCDTVASSLATDGALAILLSRVLYNFEVKYKPGKQNALADALSRRPDYELAHVTTVTSSIPDRIRASYASDDMCVALMKALGSKEFEDSDKNLSARLRARLHCYAFDGGLLYYSTGSDDPPRVVVPHDEDLKYRILYEAHDTPVGDHLGREKTYSSVSLHYWWSNLYKWEMSTTDHPQADGQTERVNHVVEDVLRSICAEAPTRWSAMLPLVEFALNNAVHASTGYTPFYVNGSSTRPADAAMPWLRA
ncbi:unnamed protein product [Phytophthora fragariaefolia]|uniref:Unnamed protein product n=1 Tax=Phytophthora fragariaefolia TaxID=1490495 RepID=A0A9W6Y0W8_9STRA|nr:unnamed protein product [Phytophthora fragariaefolia]